MELALVVVQMLQRHPGLAGLAVNDGGEPLHEGAAPGVLSGEPDRASLQQQGAEAPGSPRWPSRSGPG